MKLHGKVSEIPLVLVGSKCVNYGYINMEMTNLDGQYTSNLAGKTYVYMPYMGKGGLTPPWEDMMGPSPKAS